MTVSEFKAWLKGFGEAIDGAPTAEQWAKIAKEVEGLREAPTLTYPPGVRSPRWGQTIPAPGELDFSITC